MRGGKQPRFSFFSTSPQTSVTKLISSFKAWINPVSKRWADLKAVCPSGFPFLVFLLLFPPHPTPPLSFAHRDWLAGCGVISREAKVGGREGRPQICPYLFWAHLKQIRPGCHCLFGSHAQIKELNPSYFPQGPASSHFGPCLASQ